MFDVEIVKDVDGEPLSYGSSFILSNITAYPCMSRICEFIHDPIHSIYVFPDFSRSNIFTFKFSMRFTLPFSVLLKTGKTRSKLKKKYILSVILKLVLESFYRFHLFEIL